MDVPYRSIPDMLRQRVADSPDRPALGFPTPEEEIAWLTWAEVDQRVRALAAGLVGQGVSPGDRVAILAGTRVEWVLADFAIMCAGAVTTAVYPTTEPDEAVFIVQDSGARVVIAENAEQAAKVAEAHPNAVVLIDGEGENTLAALEARGADALAVDPGIVDRIVEQLRPEDLATIIYTSGTTGRPKGVELTHGGWCWVGVASGEPGLLSPEDLHYLWLPLSHSFGKALLCALVHVGIPTYVDGRVDKLVDKLGQVRPTLMAAPPRIYEKIYNAVVTTATAAGGLKAQIFDWSVRVGKRAVSLEQDGKPVPGSLALQRKAADRLVFSKLRTRLGGRIRILCSGAAPLSREIALFFAAAGLPLMEGYGLSETSASNFVNRPGRLRIGTVGPHLGDLECRIDTDGEVLLRGTPVMKGYHNRPRETAEVFTEDGYFRTGDIGELSEDGYLRITDRKKDLIKTSGGKYVAPSHIEGLFKSICPYTSQVIVIGQSRNFCTMLVTLDPDAIAKWVAGGPLEGRPYQEIVASPEARSLVEGYVTELNGRLNRWETIKKFTILPRDLSIEDGELTPSMKIKRRIVEKSFGSEIESLYAGTVAEV
jgi:long-chain acyl-CoA synthetase